MEGLSGAVGDGGHAFGPFQLNDAGGVLTGRSGSHRQFAESPQGIDYAMQRIASVSKGLKGQQAINAIVRRFERPADPNGEVQRASANYGKVSGGGGTSVSLPSPTSKGAQVDTAGAGAAPQAGTNSLDLLRQMFLSNAMSSTQAFASGGKAQTTDPIQMLSMLAAMQQQGGAPAGQTQQPQPPAPHPGHAPMTPPSTKGAGIKFVGDTSGEQHPFLSALAQAVKAAGGDSIKVTSGYRTPQHNKAVGGVQGSLHTRGEAMDGYAHIGGQWVPLGVALKALASKYGLRSGDQPGFFNGGTDPVHVDFGYGR